MSIRINDYFSVGAPVAIDSRLVMSFQDMINANDSVMPEVYLTVCSDDSKVYVYTKTNAPTETTGKFRVLESKTESIDANLIFGNRHEFPNIGQSNVLYVAEDEDTIYRWDSATQTYRVLRTEPQIEVIQAIL